MPPNGSGNTGPKGDATPPPVALSEEDMVELKQVIIEFLSKYEALYEKRVQKLVFYGEIYTAQETGQRLTDATFVPYDHGPYSLAVKQALEELEEDGSVSKTKIGQYRTHLESGDLSPKKKYLIDQIHEETKRMSTDEIVDRAKDTWLWQNFEYAEKMDFTKYIDEIILPPSVRHYVGELERNPVDDPDLERLFSD